MTRGAGLRIMRANGRLHRARQAPPPSPRNSVYQVSIRHITDMPADDEQEVFEVVDEENKTVGTQPRGVCHAEGLRHRAVYCLVFDPDGSLLLQQRSERKKIGPGQWDLSLAEHLQPGEAYSAAVLRGLREELGITIEETELEGPLSAPHERVLHVPGVVRDVEFVQTFRLSDWCGSLELDTDEVQGVKWLPLRAVYEELEQNPGKYTSWLRAELALLKPLLLDGRCCVGEPRSRTEATLK